MMPRVALDTRSGLPPPPPPPPASTGEESTTTTDNELAAYTTRARQPTSLGTPALGLYQPKAPREHARVDGGEKEREEFLELPYCLVFAVQCERSNLFAVYS